MKMCMEMNDNKVLKAIIDEAISDYFKQQRLLSSLKPKDEKPIIYDIK
jgi:hypothetical protein